MDYNLNSIEPTQNPQQKSNDNFEAPKKNKSLIVLITLLVVSLLVLGGVIASQYYLGDEENNTAQPELSTKIAEWKTYTNEKYGFEVDYPSDFKPNSKYDFGYERITFFNDKSSLVSWISIGIVMTMKEGTNLSFSDFGIDYVNKKSLAEDVIIYKIPAIPGRESVTFISGKHITTLISNKSKLIEIEVYGKANAGIKNLENLNDQILSTFKFIK